MSREPLPEVHVPRQLPLTGLTREAFQGLGRGAARGLDRLREWPRLRTTAAVFTTMSALAATSLLSAPSVAEPFSSQPCALKRTEAHHSEGLDTWNTAYPRPVRSLDAVMVFLSFPDSVPLTSPAELTADHFPATTRFFERASYGRFTLRPHPLADWIRMPRPSTAYAIQRDWSAPHRAAYLRDALAAADGQVDFSRYDVVYFVADPDAPGVDSDATKVVNLDTPLRADGTDIRRVVTVFENHPPDRLVLAHETGHVFDLPDLYHRPVDGRGDWDTHVGDWDLMGSQFGMAPDLFGWHKWKLGWLQPRQVACVRQRGGARITLEPLGAGPEAPARGTAGAPAFGLGGGTKLAVVRTGPDSALAFEARGPVGNDTAACRQGILVYRIRSTAESGRGPVQVIDAHPHTEACWEQSVYPPLADAPVALGESFTVPGEGVRVDVEGRTPSGAWTVRIATG
ncbi:MULTISPECIES: M6 family metalloprotease domain-containing protein [unclassified Streptomyces]|uniref:M6 family metalloprotease domain-containing protein n=1 Tax=unclassified Streptomyces TaxID=2593676 RepID=UPI001661D91A|nr:MULTISPECIES: M6 family metalloprotease domain-containing protein [unclassified Streptomyces]MBD0841824.1 M6 family metalloprotease domain-containing protein [Streptomyces sp. TRM68416]